jgi:rhodanese-related sulfurtransferase
MHRSTRLALALAFVLLPACTSEPTPPAPPPAAGAAQAAGLPDHDPALAHKLVAAGAVLLDVRSPDEFNDKHLPGAVNIPVGDLGGRLDEVKKLSGGDTQKPIVVYCASGNRAGRAKNVLSGAGFQQVTNLGSIGDWDRK